MQQLKLDKQGQYGYDSPIVHYQVGQDGVTHQVAVTTSEELRQAKAELAQLATAQVPTMGSASVNAPGRSKDRTNVLCPVLAQPASHLVYPLQ